jgi:DNA-binding IscR family transcriptional regulator
MKMNKGVEWAVHACALLAPLGARRGLSLAALADYHGVPSRGHTGGYALAKAPQEISLWDIKQAVDGSAPAFRCTEIRQKGPCAIPRVECRAPCAIAAAFGRAENAYRDLLREIRLSDILSDVTGEGNAQHMLDMLRWYEANVTVLPEKKAKAPAS